MSDIVRRAYMSKPGETLLLAMPSVEGDGVAIPGINVLLERAETLQAALAVPSTSLYVSPIVSVPLVAASVDRRSVPANMLWHPFVWLPKRMRQPYLFVSDGGAERVESLDEWAIRLSLELTGTGLYDPGTGSWADILSIMGLRLEDANTRSRIDAWRAGGADDLLDSFDLTPYVDSPDEPDWAVGLAHAMFENVIGAAWHVTAKDLAGLARQAVQMHDLNVVEYAATVARRFIGDALVSDDPEVTLAAVCDDALGGLELLGVDGLDLSDGPAAELIGALEKVRGEYAQHFDTLAEFGNETGLEEPLIEAGD